MFQIHMHFQFTLFLQGFLLKPQEQDLLQCTLGDLQGHFHFRSYNNSVYHYPAYGV